MKNILLIAENGHEAVITIVKTHLTCIPLENLNTSLSVDRFDTKAIGKRPFINEFRAIFVIKLAKKFTNM